MKKIIILLILFSVCGCSKNPIKLDDNIYSQSKIVDIKSSEFNEMIESKKSFVVFVYLNGCTSCASFRNVLEKYLNNNTLTIYSIEYEDMKKTLLNKYIKYSPSFVIINDGKVYSYLDATSDSDLKYYESVDGFTSWVKKYVLFD